MRTATSFILVTASAFSSPLSFDMRREASFRSFLRRLPSSTTARHSLSSSKNLFRISSSYLRSLSIVRTASGSCLITLTSNTALTLKIDVSSAFHVTAVA